MQVLRQVTIWMLLLMLAPGCTLMKAKEDIKKIEALAIISGTVDTDEPFKVVVVLCEPEREGYRVNQLTVVNSKGDFFFDAKDGSYVVIAFVDRNNNMMYDEGEPVGLHDNLLPIQARLNLPARAVDIKLTQDQAYPAGIVRDLSNVAHVHRINLEEVASLNDPRFSKATGTMGLWEPFRYVHEVGFGTFWLEEREPKRIPVVFVHGAGGSPNDFWLMAQNLDTEHFQPVFFYYPSGLRMAGPARLLGSVLNQLRLSGAGEIVVIAHSMGGLIARGGLLNFLATNDDQGIPLFITLSTPWGGHPAAKIGVQNSPVVLLNWYDMEPGSPFIQRLWEQALPATVDYHLLFSFKGKSSMVMGNNDGAVTIESQLDPRAQAEALRLYGHNADHVEILFEGTTVREVHQLLAGLLEAEQ